MADFTGIWVSKELIELGLSPSKTMVLSMILNMQPFHASNRYIAEKLNFSTRGVGKILVFLQEKKLIKIKGNTSARTITIEDSALASYRTKFLSAIEQSSYTSEQSSLTKEQSSTNNKDSKYIKVNNKEIVKKTPKIKAPPDPLYHPIKEAFLSKNDDQFTDWKKEAMGIKGLVKKAKARNTEHPEIFIQSMIEQFYKMTSNGEKFWGDIPFLPSKLNSSGIFDGVLKKVKDSVPKKPEEVKYEIVEGLFGN